MKMIQKILLGLILFTTSIGYAAQTTTRSNYGNESYENEKVDFIHSNGTVFLKKTSVEGEVRVNGSLFSESSDIGAVRLNGNGDFKETIVHSDTSVNGSLKALECKFVGKVSLATNRSSFTKCVVPKLFVPESDGSPVDQVIELRGNSKIEGDIVFESGQGVVELYRGSEVRGEVIGGILKRM